MPMAGDIHSPMVMHPPSHSSCGQKGMCLHPHPEREVLPSHILHPDMGRETLLLGRAHGDCHQQAVDRSVVETDLDSIIGNRLIIKFYFSQLNRGPLLYQQPYQQIIHRLTHHTHSGGKGRNMGCLQFALQKPIAKSHAQRPSLP